jgi:hypothetical protein
MRENSFNSFNSFEHIGLFSLRYKGIPVTERKLLMIILK